MSNATQTLISKAETMVAKATDEQLNAMALVADLDETIYKIVSAEIFRREEIVNEIAAKQFEMAIDQEEAYASLRESFEAYYHNAYDTAIEQGADDDAVIAIYMELVREYDEKIAGEMFTR